MSVMRTSVGVGNASVTNGIYSVNGFISSCMDGLELAMCAVLSKSGKITGGLFLLHGGRKCVLGRKS